MGYLSLAVPPVGRRVLSIVLLAVGGWMGTARAELIVFSDGRVVKAASHRVAGNAIEIGLPGGGSYTVDPARIDKIVEDEVAASSAPAAPVIPPPAARRAEAAAPVVRTQLAAPLPVQEEPPPRRTPPPGHGRHGRKGS